MFSTLYFRYIKYTCACTKLLEELANVSKELKHMNITRHMLVIFALATNHVVLAKDFTAIINAVFPFSSRALILTLDFN